jgi:membrane protein implicated in regulation of membrane protease activity
MDWIQSHGWQTWLIVSLLLALAELATLDFTLLMLAVGAAAACVVCAVGAPVVFQVLSGVAVALLMLTVVRPPLVRWLHRNDVELRSGTAGVVGRTGLVLERVTSMNGRVKVSGEVWSARTFDAHTVVEPGSTVLITEIDGATVVVSPTN